MAKGILVIDKPADWTSHDVVAKVRGLLRERRVGHAGTLDPMATGVLPVFVGRATRAVEFAAETEKEYLAGLRLGVVTDTQDSTGTVLEERPVHVSRGDLEGVLTQFRGDILQIPPMYSALKRDGKKLYELARRGVEVEREPRPITIHRLELLESSAAPWAGEDYLLRVRCSKGTYVRTLCHDIGRVLGCGGVMCALRRTEAAGFSLAQAITLDALADAATGGRAEELLLPVDSYFASYPALTVEGEALKKAHNGGPFPCRAEDGVFRVYGPDGAFLLVGRCEGGVMSTMKSFFEV